MVKYCFALLLAITFVAPAFAQDDYSAIELGFGYGNVQLPDEFEAAGLGIETGGHSGLATHQIFNLSSWMGIENYFGYYSLGRSSVIGKTELLANIFGGKFSLRRSERIIPYVSAGLGGGWLRFTDIGAGSNNAFATRIGGGVDIPFYDSLAWKVDVSRISFHFDGWQSGMNISTGIVLQIPQF